MRAVDVLRRVEVVLAAASPRNEQSLALSIAAPHLPESVHVERLDFPMTRDTAVLEKAWADNADAVRRVLESGRSAAFLTLGDPLIYSTFGYLMRTLLALAPHLNVEVVPGITSYQEAAAKTRTILCEGEENLMAVFAESREKRRDAVRLPVGAGGRDHGPGSGTDARAAALSFAAACASRASDVTLAFILAWFFSFPQEGRPWAAFLRAGGGTYKKNMSWFVIVTVLLTRNAVGDRDTFPVTFTRLASSYVRRCVRLYAHSVSECRIPQSGRPINPRYMPSIIT